MKGMERRPYQPRGICHLNWRGTTNSPLRGTHGFRERRATILPLPGVLVTHAEGDIQ
jgi:hypothetical protein